MAINDYIIKLKLYLYKKGLITLDTETINYLKKKQFKEELKKEQQTEVVTFEYYEEYDEGIEEILYETIPINNLIKSFVEKLKKNRKLFSDRLLRYVGYSSVEEYFRRVFLYDIIFSMFIFLFYLLGGNILEGIIFSIIFFTIILILGILYPRLKIIMFKGDIKLEVLFSLVYIVSLIKSGVSIMEIINRIAKSKEFGILSFEFEDIVREINIGYTFAEALQRAMDRAELPLLKKLYEQIYIGYNKGNLDLLLEKFYEEIVRESLAKLDTSKFMIQNLGNLAFGTGIILPFSGMIISSMMGNQGLPGVINTMDLLLVKIGPMLTLIFGILVKMKIE
ncbi:type II secretion system F family protein [Methanocaldococcus indicus]|uniref:type II secretion system F family protein n=1 Tax=Methanocaldococcus indicus TaxID=213231 RepID=UPI003C6D57FA